MEEYFPEVEEVEYGGPQCDDPLSFSYYDRDREVGGKAMSDHLRFSVAYWHTFASESGDPFGVGTRQRPWEQGDTPMERAKDRAHAAFEFMDKLGVDYFCFHDRDVAPAGDSLEETNRNLDEVVDVIEELMEETGIEMLWGTANLFEHPRYANGAATSPSADVFAHAAAQVKKAMEVANRLGASGYVFWGGREGYETLLNTNLGLEMDNEARFLEMAVEHADRIGFDGQLLIEPKPKEPTKHQYDFDVEHAHAFLQKYGLEDYFKANIEANHATLAGHSFQHELNYARQSGLLGSVDANQGDKLLGWDTDQFPTDVYSTTLAMYEILQAGGLKPGGLNFDAKVRRPSFEPVDLFYGHIAGMDAFARGLEVAQRLLDDGVFQEYLADRYNSYSNGIGKRIAGGEVGFSELDEYVRGQGEITIESGRQEKLESILNRYILET